MRLLECRGLSRRPWFDGFELAVDPGEVVVLAGPTASGKTLLLRAIADLDPADAGEVLLEGRERRSFAPHEWRRRVVYAHQVPPRIAGTTVRDDLARFRRFGRPGAGAEEPGDVLRSLAREGLELDPDAAVERLSGGEAQVLALARALLVAPRVLLLDEGTSALDPARGRAAERMLQEWARGGRGLLWVSHDESLAARLGARLVRFSGQAA